ncbi:MAG: hypothetical protein IJH38_04415 [Clostridia bacterium]|nr:hypothetical protein [Clostridia bacterium]
MNKGSDAAFGRLSRALETIFLVLAGVYLIYSVSGQTTLRPAWPESFEPLLLVVMAAVALLRLAILRPSKGCWLACGAVALVYSLVYRSGGYRFLLFLAVLTIGFTGVDYRRILKVYLLTVGAFYAVTVLAGFLGAAVNYVYPRVNRGVRSAWGMCYPTDFASQGLFLLMALWITDRKLPDAAFFPLAGLYTLMAWGIACSNTGIVCGAMLCAGMLIATLSRRPGLRWMQKGTDLFAMLSFGVLALIMFVLMRLYARGSDGLYRIDSLLSHRLMHSVEAWRAYGLKAFGTPFEQHGSGFSVFPSESYNFVDSSYPLILLRYGWVALTMFWLLWGRMARKAIACGDRRFAIVMGIIAVHAFSEHHFTEVSYNILAVMPLAAFEPVPAARAGDSLRARAWATGVVALAVAVVAALAGPALISRMKTVLQIMHLGYGEHKLRLVCVLLCVLEGVMLALWALRRLLYVPRAARKVPATILMLCVFVSAGGWAFSEHIINVAAREYTAVVESDREAVEIAASASAKGVCVDVLSEVYRRSISGIRRTYFSGEDMARIRGGTVLMPSDREYGAFINAGFLYVPISEDHALYTAERSVAEALMTAGYPATGYYSTSWQVDLASAAEQNGCVWDAEAGVRLGSSDSLTEGPWQDLYGGKYTAVWDLRLPQGATAGDDVVCMVNVTTYQGRNLILEKEIRSGEFDDSGCLKVSLPFSIKDSRDAGFGVCSVGNSGVEVMSISCRRTPTYDEHTFYDAKLRKVRTEYYDETGRPMHRKEGWFACDYEYDAQGNLSLSSYYDTQGNPTLIRGGYARRRREYNARRQIVRESYFDTEGAPIVGADGYAVLERAYDGAGNTVVERYYGTDGAPLLIDKGYAEIHRSFDDKGKVVREQYYGTDGAPIAMANGQFGRELGYDKGGNTALIRYLDETGSPMTLAKGYAEIRRIFNGLHQIVREAYYDVDSNPILRKEGYAAVEREYDEAGNAAVERYLDLTGTPVRNSSGYAEIHRAYNKKAQVIREMYYGEDGRPTALSYGQWGMEMEYDRVGNVSLRRYLDVQGNLMLTNRGYAQVQRQFNSQRQVVRTEYLGLDGESVENEKGYAVIEAVYGKDGSVDRRYYDINGNLVKENREGA